MDVVKLLNERQILTGLAVNVCTVAKQRGERIKLTSHMVSVEPAAEGHNIISKKCDQIWFKSQTSKVTNFETQLSLMNLLEGLRHEF